MKLSRCVEPIAQVVGDELLLLEPRNGKLHRLNAIAAWVYERCDGRTLQTIAGELSSHYEVERLVAEKDLDVLATQLAQLGLIRLVGETSVDDQTV